MLINAKEFSGETSLETQINTIVEQIKIIGRKKLDFAQLLHNHPKAIQELPERLKKDLDPQYEFWTPISKTDLHSLTIAGVDGGLTTKSLMGCDLFLCRSVSVIITYARDGIFRTSYYPTRAPRPDLLLSLSPVAKSEFERLAGFYRAKLEVTTAEQLINSSDKSIDVILMDGSILPPATQTQARVVRTSQPQSELLEALRSLMEVAEENGVLLAWVIKNSRTARFIQFLGRIMPSLSSFIPGLLDTDYRSIVRTSRDLDFFFYMLPPSARSFALKLTAEDDPRLKDLYRDIWSFYIKPARYDAPLRIEIAQQPDISSTDVNLFIKQACSIILPLSQFHSRYGLPAPIVEADARSKIHENEFEAIIGQIQRRVGFAVEEKRSPFGF
ncbi:MAG: DNA double-strand break repair nuclease NurA [Candidatus Hodarchaeota archaeon]